MWYNKVKLTHWVCSVSLFWMIYMFIMIRMGKDKKDRDKIGFFVMFNKQEDLGDREEKGSKLSSQFLLKCSPH